MPLGLVTRASFGWRRVLRIADQGLVAVLARVAAGVLASQNGSFLKAALVQNRHFWRLARVRAVAGQNVSFLKAGLVQNRHFWSFKGRACTESSFLGFCTGPGSGGPKRVILKARVATESSFLGFGTGPGVGEVPNGTFLKAGLVQHRHV